MGRGNDRAVTLANIATMYDKNGLGLHDTELLTARKRIELLRGVMADCKNNICKLLEHCIGTSARTVKTTDKDKTLPETDPKNATDLRV